MISLLTKCNVTDNSGILIIKCIKILTHKVGNIGDEIIGVVNKKEPNLRMKKPIKKGAIVRGIIVRTKKGIIRPDGTKLTFKDNAVILYSNKTEKLLGTLIYGTLTYELRKWHFLKVLSLGEKVI